MKHILFIAIISLFSTVVQADINILACEPE